MHSCWNEAPEQRPAFIELAEQVSATLEEEAGYLEMSHSLTWKTQEHGKFLVDSHGLNRQQKSCSETEHFEMQVK